MLDSYSSDRVSRLAMEMGYQNLETIYGNETRIVLHYHGKQSSSIILTDSLIPAGSLKSAWGVREDVFHNVQDRYKSGGHASLTVNNSTGTGCYSLVGKNVQVYFYHLNDGIVKVIPSSQDYSYIHFHSDDVLGLYVESAGRGRRNVINGVVIRTSPSSFTRKLVWYASQHCTMQLLPHLRMGTALTHLGAIEYRSTTRCKGERISARYLKPSLW